MLSEIMLAKDGSAEQDTSPRWHTRSPSKRPAFLGLNGRTLLVIFSAIPVLWMLTYLKPVDLPHVAALARSHDQQSRPLVIQSRYRYIERPYVTKNFTDYLDRTRGNYGDCLWEYAAQRLLDQERLDHCHGGRDECLAAFPKAQRVIHYLPCANDLYEKDSFLGTHGRPSLLNSMIANISSVPDPHVLLGIGTQGFFSRNKARNDVGGASAIELGPDDYTPDPLAVSLLHQLEARKLPAFMRGSFSNAVARLHGYSHGVESGCPTIMINSDERLGRTLQTRYDDVAARVGDKSLKVAINMRSFGRMFNVAMRIYHDYPNSVLFAQGPSDLRTLHGRNVSWERVRVFQADVPGWLEELKKMDVAIGPRIHGNMAAFATMPPVPVFLIAPDYRVLELGEAMRVPMADIYDRRIVQPNIDVAELIRDSKFDGEAFDQNRCRLAKLYVSGFAKVGLIAAPHVLRISAIC